MTPNGNTSDFAAFLREHRSNESSFDTIYTRFKKEAAELSNADAIETKAEVYEKAKETRGTAWPEFESFVSELEKAIVKV